MANFFKRWLEYIPLRGSPLKDPTEKKASHKSVLVKSRPEHLPQRQYTLLHDRAVVDAAFSRLKAAFLEGLREERRRRLVPHFRLESGKLGEGRSYFFLVPWNEAGFLFEQSETGWLVAKADKIEDRQMFLRRSELWDRVNLYRPDGTPGLLRLNSERLGSELLSFPVYQDELMRLLALDQKEVAV